MSLSRTVSEIDSMLVGSCLQCRGASAIYFVNHWWHLHHRPLSPFGHVARLDHRVPTHDALRLMVDFLRKQEGNGQLEKTAGSPSQHLAQQGSWGCRRYTAAIYGVEIWDRQGSRSGATVHSDYATMMMTMKDDLCQKWRVKLIFQGTYSCPKPGLLSIWKSLT